MQQVIDLLAQVGTDAARLRCRLQRGVDGGGIRRRQCRSLRHRRRRGGILQPALAQRLVVVGADALQCGVEDFPELRPVAAHREAQRGFDAGLARQDDVLVELEPGDRVGCRERIAEIGVSALVAKALESRGDIGVLQQFRRAALSGEEGRPRRGLDDRDEVAAELAESREARLAAARIDGGGQAQVRFCVQRVAVIVGRRGCGQEIDAAFVQCARGVTTRRDAHDAEFQAGSCRDQLQVVRRQAALATLAIDAIDRREVRIRRHAHDPVCGQPLTLSRTEIGSLCACADRGEKEQGQEG